MANRKTLHDVVKVAHRPKSHGSIPHVFHRHGALAVHEGNNFIIKGSATPMPVTTETEKMTAYGTVAAGDVMVTENANAEPSMIHALRTAVAHRIMNEVGVYEEPVGMKPLVPIGVHGVYWDALEALRHYGTANERGMMANAKKSIKSAGLRHQANILPSLIHGAIEMALDYDHAGLEWFYKEFHSLYGNESKPRPNGNPDIEDIGIPKEEYSIPEIIMKGKSESADGLQWGELSSIQNAPMSPWKHPQIRSKASWKYSEFGVFKYPWRALPSSDFRCFSLRRHKYSGTLLIDMSGSMSVNQYHVDKILDMAPYSTIACYGSDPAIEGNTHGRIVVIASGMKKGAAGYARECIGQGNVIDGHALRWLASQAAPRIWVSDGGVTGVGDHPGANLVGEADDICHSGKITRIQSLPVLIEKLT